MANNWGPRAEILKYNVNVEPNLGPRLFATLSITFYMIFNLLLNFQFWFVLATRVIPMRILIKFDLNINLIHQVYKMLVEARHTRRSKVPIRVQSESSSALLTDHRPSVVF